MLRHTQNKMMPVSLSLRSLLTPGSCMVRLLVGLSPSHPSSARAFFSPFSSTSSSFSPPSYSSGFSSFTDLAIDDKLVRRLNALDIHTPTPIQTGAIQAMFSEMDKNRPSTLLIHAQPGSGKSLAFLLPIISKIRQDIAIEREEEAHHQQHQKKRSLHTAVPYSNKKVHALIMVPTRELAMQMYAQVLELTTGLDNPLYHPSSSPPLAPSSSSSSSFSSARSAASPPEINDFAQLLVGGIDVHTQVRQLVGDLAPGMSRPCILIGTPSRLLSLFASQYLVDDTLSKVNKEHAFLPKKDSVKTEHFKKKRKMLEALAAQEELESGTGGERPVDGARSGIDANRIEHSRKAPEQRIRTPKWYELASEISEKDRNALKRLVVDLKWLVVDEADDVLDPLSRYAKESEKYKRDRHVKAAPALLRTFLRTNATTQRKRGPGHALQLIFASASTNAPLRRDILLLTAPSVPEGWATPALSANYLGDTFFPASQNQNTPMFNDNKAPLVIPSSIDRVLHANAASSTSPSSSFSPGTNVSSAALHAATIRALPASALFGYQDPAAVSGIVTPSSPSSASSALSSSSSSALSRPSASSLAIAQASALFQQPAAQDLSLLLQPLSDASEAIPLLVVRSSLENPRQRLTVPRDITHHYTVCEDAEKLDVFVAIVRALKKKDKLHWLQERRMEMMRRRSEGALVAVDADQQQQKERQKEQDVQGGQFVDKLQLAAPPGQPRQQGPPALVFVHAAIPISRFVADLEARGIRAVSLHEATNGSVAEYNLFMKRFALPDTRDAEIARGLPRIDLVVLSINTARGLDFPALSRVFVLNMPTTAPSYLHVAGRLNRRGRTREHYTMERERQQQQQQAGLNVDEEEGNNSGDLSERLLMKPRTGGTVYSIVSPRETSILARLSKYLEVEFENLPVWLDGNQERGHRTSAGQKRGHSDMLEQKLHSSGVDAAAGESYLRAPPENDELQVDREEEEEEDLLVGDAEINKVARDEERAYQGYLAKQQQQHADQRQQQKERRSDWRSVDKDEMKKNRLAGKRNGGDEATKQPTFMSRKKEAEFMAQRKQQLQQKQKQQQNSNNNTNDTKVPYSSKHNTTSSGFSSRRGLRKW